MATTWNPSDKTALITLTSGNLAASSNSPGSSGAEVRAVDYGSASDLLYCEVVINPTGSFGGTAVGFSNATFVLGTDDSSNSPNAITAWTDGNVYCNSASAIGPWTASITNGDVCCIAVRTTDKTFWARKNSGNWNNSGTANPVTNTGGYAIPNAGPYTAITTLLDAGGGTTTLRVAALSIPSGFTDMMGANFPFSFRPRMLLLGAG